MGGSIKRYMKFVKPYNWQILLTIFIGIVKFAIPLFIHFLLRLSLMILSGHDIDAGRNDAAILLLARGNGAYCSFSSARLWNIIDNIMLSM